MPPRLNIRTPAACQRPTYPGLRCAASGLQLWATTRLNLRRRRQALSPPNQPAKTRTPVAWMQRSAIQEQDSRIPGYGNTPAITRCGMTFTHYTPNRRG